MKVGIHLLVVYLHCHICIVPIIPAGNIRSISLHFTTSTHLQIRTSAFCRRPNGGVKTVFFNKTGNPFVETGYLPVIGLHDVMCHVAAVLKRKAASEVKRG